MRRLNIRWRLTLWFGAAMVILLVVRTFWIYFMLEQRLTARTDSELDAELEALQQDIQQSPDRSQLQQTLERHAAGRRDLGVDVLTPEGQQLFNLPLEPLPRAAVNLPALHDLQRRYLTRVSPSGARERVVESTIPSKFGPLQVEIRRSMQDKEDEIWSFIEALLTTIPMVIVASLVVGYLVSTRALTPVDTMISAANHITARRLNQRIDVPDTGDELSRLARTLNAMIDRLDHSFTEMRRFTADAAHDLRTPVAALRTEVEVGLMANRTIEEYRHSLQVVLDEAIHLSRLTGQLLDLSREDHGLPPADELVHLDLIVRDVIEDLQPAAKAKGITITADNLPEGAIAGGPVRIRRVCMNLLENAIQYTQSGGHVSVEVEYSPEDATVIIADDGPGVPPEELPNIFDRFRRVDKARTSQIGGTGLGLAICKSIVEAHGGRIAMDSEIGKGTRVTVTLPRNAPQPAVLASA